MTADLYPQGSLQEAAFTAVLALPTPSETYSDSTGEAVARISKMLSDVPEAWFPCSAVACWLQETGIEVQSIKCAAAASQLHDAFFALTCLETVIESLRDDALPNREKAGTGNSLRVALSRIAQSAAHLSADLRFVRFELLYRRTLGEDGSALERLYVALHDAISFWHSQSPRGANANQSMTPSLAPCEQRGMIGALTETWLEHGFDSMKAKASKALMDETIYRGHLGSSSARIREDFVRRVALAWENAVGARPSMRRSDDGKLSSFQIFYSRVCGHTAGLLAREARWPTLSTADQLKFRQRLQSLGLLKLPSASTFRRAIHVSHFPEKKRGKKVRDH